MKTAAHYLIAASLIASLTGCNEGSSGSDSGAKAAEYYYPTKTDQHEEGDGDDAVTSAVVIETNTSYNKTLFPAGDKDWAAVTLAAGTKYEITVNQLCATCDTVVALYEEVENGYSLVASDDDYIAWDSAITFTPQVSKEYFILVSALNVNNGVSNYILNVHEFIDADEDEYSSFYDCNDSDNTIYPMAIEGREDKIDQDCNGSDLLRDNSQDAFEKKFDYKFENATELPFIQYNHNESVFIFQQHKNDVHTLHSTSDVDWLKFTIPAHSAINLFADYHTDKFNLLYSLYKNDGVTPAEHEKELIENQSNNAATYYIKFSTAFDAQLASRGYYMPYATFLGFDNDKDGFYSMDFSTKRDCNDNDTTINPDATETDDDNIDSNCDGQDNAPELAP
jgi:hypothetical protein